MKPAAVIQLPATMNCRRFMPEREQESHIVKSFQRNWGWFQTIDPIQGCVHVLY